MSSRTTSKQRSGETDSEYNDRLVQKMRDSGKEYLKSHPKAFGGGINPETGVRYDESGQRVSVTTPEEQEELVSKTRAIGRAFLIRNPKAFGGEGYVERMREGGRSFLARNPKAFGGGIDAQTGFDYKQYAINLQKTLPSGEKLILDDNYNIIAIQSNRLGQTIKLDETGVRLYNEKIGREAPFTIKKYAKELRQQELLTGQSTKAPKLNVFGKGRKAIEDRLRFMDIQTINNRLALRKSNKNNTLNKLGDLQNKEIFGGGLNARETQEKIRLTKEVSRNYKMFSENIFNIIYGSIGKTYFGLYDLGGIVVKELKDGKTDTLKALPPALLSAIILDLKRFASGDPLDMASVPLEYWSMGQALSFMGKGANLTYKNSIKLGRFLVPEYFKGIARELKITGKITGRISESALRDLRNAMKLAGRNTTTAKAIRKYVAKLEKTKGVVDRKIKIITNKARQVNKYVVRKTERVTRVGKIAQKDFTKKVDIARRNIAYKKSLQTAKKARIQASKKARDVRLDVPDYKRARIIIDDLTEAVAKYKALEFVNKYLESGGKLNSKQVGEFVDAVIAQYKNTIGRTNEYRTLLELSGQERYLTIKIIKVNKIQSARIFLNNLSKKLNSFNSVKMMKRTLSNVKRGIKSAYRVTIKSIKIAGKNTATAKAIRKYKTESQLKRELANAKKVRARAGKKGKTLWFGDTKYSYALYEMELAVKDLAKKRASAFIKKYEKVWDSRKLGSKIEFPTALEKNMLKRLYRTPEYVRLKDLAKLNELTSARLIKTNKAQTARVLARKILKKINSMPIFSKVARVGRKISPRRAIRKVNVRLNRVAGRIAYRKTLRYRMEKTRPVRIVSVDKIIRTSSITRMNAFIDSFFNELGRRQKINISAEKFLQMKNLLKKRMKKAITTRNKAEIENFAKAIKELQRNMEKKSAQPDVKVIEQVGRVKRFRTIKDFEVVKPRGTYVEVKVGNQVMLQEVKQVAKQKTKQVQRMRIKAVQKKAIDLRPMLMFGVLSLSAEAVRGMSRSKSAFARMSGSATTLLFAPDSRQDFRTLQEVGLAFTPKVNIATAVASAIKPKTKTLQRTIQKTTTKKKKLRLALIPRRTKGGTSKKYPGYNVVIKRRSRFMKQNSTPLSASDAKDLMAYILDTTPARTGKVVPVGLVSRLGSIRANINGYYSKNSRKFRVFRIRKGRMIMLGMTWIEKRKFALDTRGEKRTLRRLRTVKKRRIVRRRRRR